MKKPAAILLMLCCCYQMVVKVGIVAWYNINKEYVAAELCENRDKPELNCCGKCYLNKQINKVDQNTGSEKQTVKLEKTELIAILYHNEILLTPFIAQEIIRAGVYRQPTGFEPILSVFHPPPYVVA